MRNLGIALVLLGSFAGVELGAGLISHSLALVAEAGHMLSDGLVLGLSLLAAWLGQLSPSQQATFGYRRIEILAALVNGLVLVAVAGWIGWEAVTHLQRPNDLLSLPMLLTATAGLAVNGCNALLLHQGSQHNLNLRGAWLHMLADVFSSLGVIAAALLVWRWGWTWADGAISLGVAVLIGATAIPLIRQSLQVLLESCPPHLDTEQVRQTLQQFDGVLAVQNLRIWTIALGQEVLSAHLTVSFIEGSKQDRLLQTLQTHLRQQFGLSEVFLQLSSGLPLEPMNSFSDVLLGQTQPEAGAESALPLTAGKRIIQIERGETS